MPAAQGPAILNGILSAPSIVSPPTFEQALRLGLGRALQLLKAATTDERAALAPVVLATCLHEYGFDPQVEGPRGPYLYEAAELAGLVPELRARLMAVLGPGAYSYEAHWVFSQRLDLLVECARHGDEEADRFVFDQLRAWVTDDESPLELVSDAVMRLDPRRGLLASLRAFGQRLRACPDWPIDRTWLDQARGKAGTDTVEAVIATLASSEEDARFWLDREQQLNKALREERRRRKAARQATPQGSHADRTPLTAEAVLTWARTRPAYCGVAAAWARHADPAGLQLLAEHVLSEPDRAVRRALLCVFFRHPFPLGPAPLLPLVWDEDDVLAQRAAMALERLTGPEVRGVALRLLQDPQRAWFAVGLLTRNFVTGDEEALRTGASLVLASAPAGRDGDGQVHAFLQTLQEITDTHRTPALLALLAESYAFQPCAHCRAELVRVLNDASALPIWLRDEASLDASPDLRAFLRAGHARSSPRLRPS